LSNGNAGSYLLDRYRPRPEWFHNPSGIHGLAHIARVLVWSNRLAEALLARGKRLDLEVVRRAAQFHDVGRVNDGGDHPHGRQSALWVAANARSAAPDLSDGQREHVAYCCRWHVEPDRDVPDMTAELCCLKDGDGLDRVRIHDLDARLLRTREARGWESDAWTLYNATAYEPTWEAVRAAALVHGWWE
jgi:hypothetical protein